MRFGLAVTATALGVVGCLGESTSQYRSDGVVRTLPPQKAIQATTEAATRVDSLGRTIVARNPRIGIRPLFQTIGTPEPEIFHRGTSEIVTTQKLVEMCPTDAELAAVLCLEIGKMIAEREALALQNGRKAPPMPPLDPQLPKSVTVDQFRQAELARFEEEYGVGPSGLPDPRELARTYLQQTGFSPESLDKVRTQLRAAEKNSALEGQMTGRFAVPTPFQPPLPR